MCDQHPKYLLLRVNDCDLTDVEHWGKVIKQVQIWSVDSSSVNNANPSHAHSSSCTPGKGLTGTDASWATIMSKQRKTCLPMLPAAHMTMISANGRMGRNIFLLLLVSNSDHRHAQYNTHPHLRVCTNTLVLLVDKLRHGVRLLHGAIRQIQITLHAFNVRTAYSDVATHRQRFGDSS